MSDKTKYVIVWRQLDTDNDIEEIGADSLLYDSEEEAKARFETIFKELCESTWADYEDDEKSFEVSGINMCARCQGDTWNFQICQVSCKE